VTESSSSPLSPGRGTPLRHIAFQQVFNFRDLGGYPAGDGLRVRWRRVFRADGLNRLQSHEEAAFAELGIATVIDLRTNEEVDQGRFPSHVPGVTYHHFPMFDVLPDWPEEIGEPADYLSDRYLEMLATGRSSVAASLEVLSIEAAHPLVFHCAAGKDRTGIMAALLLALLGVDDGTIASDYALSGQAMERLMAWAREEPGVFARPRTPVPAVAVEARPETMLAFLRKVRAGTDGADGVATGLGLDPDLPLQLRRLLLEEA
jgi:protein-tyrosine phosphatase